MDSGIWRECAFQSSPEVLDGGDPEVPRKRLISILFKSLFYKYGLEGPLVYCLACAYLESINIHRMSGSSTLVFITGGYQSRHGNKKNKNNERQRETDEKVLTAQRNRKWSTKNNNNPKTDQHTERKGRQGEIYNGKYLNEELVDSLHAKDDKQGGKKNKIQE